jgi:hypothetical protein
MIPLLIGVPLDVILSAGIQTQSPPLSEPATAFATAPAPAPAASRIWSVGMQNFSGYIEDHYINNANRPIGTANGHASCGYNVNALRQDVAVAAREQISPKGTQVGRLEYFDANQGFSRRRSSSPKPGQSHGHAACV